MSNNRKKEERKSNVFGLQKHPSRVKNPFRGKTFSKAVLAASASLKKGLPLLGVKRGCAAHGAVPICSFLLNRLALGTGRGPALCALTSEKHLHRYTALCSPFFQRHHFAPLQKAATWKKGGTWVAFAQLWPASS